MLIELILDTRDIGVVTGGGPNEAAIREAATTRRDWTLLSREPTPLSVHKLANGATFAA